MSHSIEEYCLAVNPSGFKMPDVVLKQRSRCHKLVFIQLYLDSDELGKAVLNADLLGAKLNISRRAVYNSLLFLKRVNLLQVLEERRGRGQHSLVRLLWRKPAAKQERAVGAALPHQSTSRKAPRLAEPAKPIRGNSSSGTDRHQRSSIATHRIRADKNIGKPSERANPVPDDTRSSPDKKCAGLSIKDIKTSYLRYDRAGSLNGPIFDKPQWQPRQKQPGTDPIWNRKMRVFRQLLEKSWLLPYEQRICAAVLGRYIKNKSTEFSRKLYEQLAKIVQKLDAPNWVRQVQDLCKWFMGVLVGSVRVAGITPWPAA